jgi:hypothetical protein
VTRSDDRPYSLLHSNVDGAGLIDRFATFAEARAEADRLQAESDQGGNPWGYRYSVFTGIDRCLYRTRPGALPDQEAER